MKLGFIGAGKMATAIARGAVRRASARPGEFIGSARTAASRATGSPPRPRVRAHTADNFAVATGSEMPSFCASNPPTLARSRARSLPRSPKATTAVCWCPWPPGCVWRICKPPPVPPPRSCAPCPTPPASSQRGASAYARGLHASDADAALVERIFSALGDAHAVPETLIDAVNGLSGSGPAYVYLVIEALADGGVLMGLPRALAASLAAQTVLGAAEIVRQTGMHPGGVARGRRQPRRHDHGGARELGTRRGARRDDGGRPRRHRTRPANGAVGTQVVRTRASARSRSAPGARVPDPQQGGSA